MVQPSAAPGGRQTHFDYLDGLRGAAAVYVTLHHIAFNLTDRAPVVGEAQRLLRALFSGGNFAVDFFITLSGFCLMLAVQRGKLRTWGEFFGRRALRILPAYYAAMALALLLNLTLFKEPTGKSWDRMLGATSFDILTHIFMVAEWWESSALKINYVFWSIGVEWKIYLIFPLLILLWRRSGTAALLAMVPLSYGIWSVQSHLDLLNPNIHGSSVYYVGLFCAGMAAVTVDAQALFASPARRRAALAVLAVLMLSLPGISLYQFLRQQWIGPLSNIAGGCAAAMLLLCLRAGLLPRTQAALSWKPLVWCGVMGYSLYLVHAVVIQFFALYAFPPRVYHDTWPVLGVFAVVSLSCLGVSRLFYLAVERPFHEISHRWQPGAARRLQEGPQA